MNEKPDRASALIMVFAKAPLPGLVKTRLIPVLGPELAADLHARMTQRTLRTARMANIGAVELWCAPDTAAPFFADCAQRFDVLLRRQPGGDLGERMARALADGLARARHAVLIGTDCPALTHHDLTEAYRALREHDAVFAPAEDGGYVLIGLGRYDPGLFEAIDWGTGRVIDQTRQRLRTLRWTWQELPMKWDVDTPDDLTRLAASGLLDAPR